MTPIETSRETYLFSIVDWYTHFRRMESHKTSLRLAKEKAASMWICDNKLSTERIAEELIEKINKLLRGDEHEA